MKRPTTFRFLACAALAALAGAPAATALEGGLSINIPGLRGPTAGVVPPPGVYFQNDFYVYNGRLGGGRNIAIGGAVVGNVKGQARVNFATPIWVTPIEVFGGSVAVSASLPFGVPRVGAGLLIEAPRLDREFIFNAKEADLQFGDPILGGLIGWHAGDFHFALGTSVNVPGGGYREGNLSNLPFNRWIGDFYGALTWLDPQLGLAATGVAGFTVNGNNLDTGYNSGNEIHFDLAISQSFTPQFSVGLLASYYQQVSDDSGRASRLIGPFRTRLAAVGGQIGYNFKLGDTPVATRVVVMREVYVANKTQGTSAIFELSLPIPGL